MTTLDDVLVSIVVPCRNERRCIAACLDSIMASDFPKDHLEVLVVDGMSDDGTRAIVSEIAAANPLIRLIDNAQRTTPCALNAGIRYARGDIIVRIDAHAAYPPDYVRTLLRWMEQTGADNVGGVLVTRPGGDGLVARAIAIATAHPFGVGNSWFRIGTDRPRWVNTVPFGCYRRATLDRIGRFDEDLVRNQDDELNSRLIRAGGRILLVPDVEITYFARPTLRQLSRMYYQYGVFKPLVIRKMGAILTARQLVPGAFVATLAAGAAIAPLHPAGAWALLAVAGSYAAANLAVTARVLRGKSKALFLPLVATFATMHLAYGLGFQRGVWRFGIRPRQKTVSYADVPLSR